jgi:aconitate hydratase 2/2-methylisocitrate dehydratase
MSDRWLRQDTTGPMTRDELKDFGLSGFTTADLVMQSFCHTSAYPQNQSIFAPIMSYQLL